MEINEIVEKLKKNIKKSRFIHTNGVAYTAASLAMRYDPSLMEDALRAGLLHDCAKYMSSTQNIEFCKENGIVLTDFELNSPSIIHAKTGEYIAEHEYDEHDNAVLGAIRWHTTGKPDMTLLEKIVFVADYIEPGRYLLPNLDHIRELAFTDLDECIVSIYENTIKYLKECGQVIDPITLEAYDHYRNKQQIKN